MAIGGGILAMMHTTVFPEIIDSAEISSYSSHKNYDSEVFQAYLSSLFVFLTSIGQTVAMISANTLVTLVGYNWTFIILGASLITFALVYLIACGLGPTWEQIKLSEKTESEIDDDEDLDQMSNSTTSLPRTSKLEVKMNKIKIGNRSHSMGSASYVSMTGPI